mmetsp:Transcript_48814/g.97732  ORF Transcript_48814/g.97732 Transcript_48814/m.97732 type:complete len:154 (+) Transcript_48814:304-765(+)
MKNFAKPLIDIINGSDELTFFKKGLILEIIFLTFSFLRSERRKKPYLRACSLENAWIFRYSNVWILEILFLFLSLIKLFFFRNLIFLGHINNLIYKITVLFIIFFLFQQKRKFYQKDWSKERFFLFSTWQVESLLVWVLKDVLKIYFHLILLF